MHRAHLHTCENCGDGIRCTAPIVREDSGALAMMAQQLAAIVERRTGVPTSAASVYDDARALASTYLRTYRRVAERER